MPGEILTVARTPIAELAEEVKQRYGITGSLVDTRIEGDILVMYFARNDPRIVPAVKRGVTKGPPTQILSVSRRRRSKKGKRNRMRTRGWEVVDRFVNSKGQTATIYKPFVDALMEEGLSPSQQRSIVAEILKANGNRPGPSSIDYFMMNTLEYLRRKTNAKGE